MYNIFIEGIQGTGKTTLLRELEQKLPTYKAFYEGKLSPIELAWCSYLTFEEYDKICEKYVDVKEEIIFNTLTEDEYKVVAYTKILTDYEGFHRYLEEFTIYHGNKCFEEFKSIILKRYKNLNTEGNIFESSLFQYSITTMMLFYEKSDEEILKFYKEVFEILNDKRFKLIYIDTDDLSETIRTIKGERVDNHCNEVWFPPLVRYIETSPVGLKMKYDGFDGVVSHLVKRKQLELRIIREIIKDKAIIIKSKDYDLNKIVNIGVY